MPNSPGRLRSGRQRQLFPSCIYCGAEALSKDHAPPKLFLEKPYPPNLLTVPSCSECNQGFSEDERYVRDVLHQVSFNPVSHAKLDEGGVVDRSLRHSPGLEERILSSLAVGEDGRVYLQPELERFKRVLVKIARGLWFGDFGYFPGIQHFSCLTVCQEGQLPNWALEMIFGSRALWPEVGSNALARAATQSQGDGKREYTRWWKWIQDGIFGYGFYFGFLDRKEMVCIVSLYETLWACISCPRPRQWPRNRTVPGR